MGRLNKGIIGAWIVVALPGVASADILVAVLGSLDTKTDATIGGTAALDVVGLRAGTPGVPLRYGGVVQNSERVQLNGRLLTAGADYAMDYATGVVYLKVPQKTGDSLTVAYRYSGKPGNTPSNGFSGINGFTYNVLPGSVNMLMGLGMAERGADGTVLSSNVFGWNNTFKFGQSGSLGGLYVFADRQKTTNQAGLQMDQNAKPGDASTDAGKSQFLLQSFKTGLAGGTFSLDYQDISKNFAGFGAVRQAGYADADVSRFQAERGLKRTGFAFKDLKLGGLAFSNGYRQVGDESGGVTWRSMGVQQGGVKLGFSSQSVDAGFQRFKDLSESDREQLMRERGMSRQNLTGEFAQRAGKLNFSSQSVADDKSGKGIVRREAGMDLGKFKFGYGEQEVAAGFTRIASLTGAEQAQWGREAGIHRQWMSANAELSKTAGTLSFNEMDLKSTAGRFTAQDIGYTGKTWSLSHSSRGSTANYASMGAFQDAEADGHVRAIAAMYGSNVEIKPSERGQFLAGAGIGRDLTRIQVEPFKKFQASFQTLKLTGRNDGGQVDTLAVSSDKLKATFRHQALGQQFTDVSRLMELERNRLGTLAGLDRTDISLAYQFGGAKRFEFSRLSASTSEGTAERTTVALNTKSLDLSIGERKVGQGFASVNRLVDNEKDLLAALRGYSERDVKLRWEAMPSLKLQMTLQEASNGTSGELRRFQNTIVDWNPDKRTQLNFTRQNQKNTDPLSTLFVNSVDRFTLGRDFGRFGKLQLADERIDYDGLNANLPSSHKQFMAFETKLTDKTSVRTEQTRTAYDNGDKENVSSNILSTELSKRAGVSVADTKIDRGGDERDEAKRNYGFWYDLGRGVRVSYGYARQMSGESAGNMSSTLSVGQNAAPSADQVGSVKASTVGDLSVGGAYGVNRYDGVDSMRTQSFSNLSLATVKPLHFGSVTGLRFNFGLDTAADYSNWLRENRVMGVSGKLGANSFGFEYRGQMAPSGDRGIDRTFKLATDESPSKRFSANMSYKVRTLPSDQQYMIRDLGLTARPTRRLEITNMLRTNPEVVKTDAILGTIPQAARSNKWLLDYKSTADTTVGASWEELINEQNNAHSTTGGVNLKMFQRSGSPMSLFYGIEQQDGSLQRRLTHRYHVQFDQRPGVNQQFSLFLGNVSYEHSIADNAARNNWTMRLDYQLRF